MRDCEYQDFCTSLRARRLVAVTYAKRVAAIVRVTITLAKTTIRVLSLLVVNNCSFIELFLLDQERDNKLPIRPNVAEPMATSADILSRALSLEIVAEANFSVDPARLLSMSSIIDFFDAPSRKLLSIVSNRAVSSALPKSTSLSI